MSTSLRIEAARAALARAAWVRGQAPGYAKDGIIDPRPISASGARATGWISAGVIAWRGSFTLTEGAPHEALD